ncbi:MAG: hypothetical protein IPI85_02670 [Dehalococcoidia bacterium]|nr:hypothetical protein [Dehalococcoidia bacterium]
MKASSPDGWPPAILLEGHMDVLRDLRGRGVPLVAASSYRRHPAKASTSITGSELSPALWDAAYERWFESAIARYEGAVVFPLTEDDSWWLDGFRATHPETTVRITVPPREAFRTVTLKWELYQACQAHGIAAPATWLARSPADVRQRAGDLKFPVIVKPQSRCGNLHWGRGEVANNAEELEESVSWALNNVRFRDEVADPCPDVRLPLVQEAIGGRDRRIYHIAGYLSQSGTWAALAHRKLLQFPRRFGNGLCFETASLDVALAERLVEMLRAIGFHGMFEAEFIERGDERLLIDLNPRAYNGMTLEVERGLHVAWYAYLEAAGELDLLDRELGKAHQLEDRQFTWCRKLEFGAMLASQLASGGFTPREASRWVGWYRRNRGRMLDPFVIQGDRRVGRARLRFQLSDWVRHPRRFVGTYARRESGR